MWKQLLLITVLGIIAFGPMAKADETQNVIDHYSKSGSIPPEEARLMAIKNYQLLKKEEYLYPSRKIASAIQQEHIIKIINTPLEIKAK